MSSCYVFEQMEFCPIQLEIKEEFLKSDLKSQYVLQVWNREGKKILQKSLKSIH